MPKKSAKKSTPTSGDAPSTSPETALKNEKPVAATAAKKATGATKSKSAAKKSTQPKSAKSAGSKSKRPAGPTDDDIRLRAYFIGEWRQRESVAGNSDSDWIEARRQLLSEAGLPAV